MGTDRRGTEGVQTGGEQRGYRKGTEGVQEGYKGGTGRRGTEGVQEGYRGGTGGVKRGYRKNSSSSFSTGENKTVPTYLSEIVAMF